MSHTWIELDASEPLICLCSVIFAVLVAATSVTQVAPQIAVVAKSCSAAESLFRIIDRESQLDPLTNAGITLSKAELKGDIEIRDVHFSYPSRSDVPILKGLSIKFPANKTTALVGASGSGKSTIIGLIERWYNCPHGQVILDGIDVADLDVQWLRTQVRLVQQVELPELVMYTFQKAYAYRTLCFSTLLFSTMFDTDS